jgi:hypothetical protein
MAEVLGIGVSHFPLFSGQDEDMSRVLQWTLEDPDIPSQAKDSTSWPERMQREWSNDKGAAAAAEHRAALIADFERTRQAIDAFRPDAVVIWGDDQYENFREDVIPPYGILAYENLDIQPWKEAHDSSVMKGRPNIWDEPASHTITVRGQRQIAKYFVEQLLREEFDPAYAYERLHHQGLPHAFLNAVLYLDYHRTGFDYPVIPFPINCYGRRVISYKGLFSRFAEVREMDPPSPSPRRLVALGEAVGRIASESPWRIALVASSSWSHAFLTDSTWRLRPDTDADMKLYDALVSGDLATWRSTSLEEIEAAGQQELLNWFPLLGAMSALGRTKPTWHDFVATDIFNSNKVFSVYDA